MSIKERQRRKECQESGSQDLMATWLKVEAIRLDILIWNPLHLEETSNSVSGGWKRRYTSVTPWGTGTQTEISKKGLSVQVWAKLPPDMPACHFYTQSLKQWGGRKKESCTSCYFGMTLTPVYLHYAAKQHDFPPSHNTNFINECNILSRERYDITLWQVSSCFDMNNNVMAFSQKLSWVKRPKRCVGSISMSDSICQKQEVEPPASFAQAWPLSTSLLLTKGGAKPAFCTVLCFVCVSPNVTLMELW